MNHPRKQWAFQRPGNLLPVFFLSLFFGSSAQGIFPDAFSLARGGLYTVGTDEGFSPYNPALLSENRGVSCMAGHARPYAFGEIGVTSAGVILPVDQGTFRLKLSGYGISGYNDISMELGYGMQLSEGLSAGVSFQYYNTTALGDWNYLWTIGCGGGLHYAPSEATRIGIILLNPVTVNNHSGYGPLFPAMIAAGLSQRIYKNTYMLLEFAYTNTHPYQLKLGLEYALNEWISFAFGTHSTPFTYAFGAGFNPGNVDIHFATSWSALPGIHPSILFIWLPRK